MSDDNSIFDELDEASEEPATAQSYEDWWVPDEMGQHLMGVIVEVHSAPEQYTDSGEVPDPIYTVLSVGRGDFDEGEAYCTKTHVQILNGLDGAEIGDLVNLRHKGLERTDNGNAANTYEIGVIKESTWEESDQADDIEELLDGYSGGTGDNRRSEPYGAPGGSSSGGSDDGDGETAADFLMDLVDMQNGEMDVDSAEKMLNEVRDFGADVEEVAEEADLSVEDGTVTA